MNTKYRIFCSVVENKSFTRVAEMLNYSQSAVSQTVKSLENELGTALVTRDKGGIELTGDGREYYPYIQEIANAEKSLWQKHREMQGLSDSVIKIGTFTSVSRNILPPLMSKFKQSYPGVKFELYQGEYTSIAQWIKSREVDFGFVNSDAVTGLECAVLITDELFAVLPNCHKMAKKSSVSLADLCTDPFILLDEGKYSVAENAFARCGLKPNTQYKVYDDNTILAMVRQNLGISLMYGLVLSGLKTDLQIRPVKEKPQRPTAIAWYNRDTMPLAAKIFMDFVLSEAKKQAILQFHTSSL